ncbi:MAG: pyruvate formate lyase family protein, partial [Methanobrevibacter sp.]|nr:pyruvate formate lyase family protein [Methanobrevibacter sp.]
MNPLFKRVARKTYHKAQENHLGKRFIILAFTMRKLTRRFGTKEKASSYMAKNMHKFYITRSKFNKGAQIKNLFRKIDIDIPKDGFIFFLDEFKNLSEDGHIIDNISVDYSRILKYSITDYKELNLNSDYFNDYNKSQTDMLGGIELFIRKITKELEKSQRDDKEKYIQFFENIIDKSAEHFEEALQRILFFNQLLWQTGHGLNGLGRLDKILGDYYKNDLKNGMITKDESYGLIKSFLKSLHSYYWYKSAALMGDTGQVIILGGKEPDGTYFANDLTYLFIEAIRELQLPDPKALLRVSKNTPRDLIELALLTINTGCGSPLLSNDDIVIEKMIEFGYDIEDAHNYVVSACWEPSAVGKGFEQNNINFISFLKPLNKIFDNNSDEFISEIKDFDTLFEIYKNSLKEEAEDLINVLDAIEWNEDPLLSMFIDDCNQ